MPTAMPVLETARLRIRPFEPDDLEAAHIALSRAWALPEEQWTEALPARARWLQWSAVNHAELASLNQPPYGDRAVVLRETGELIGSAGLTPAFGPFGQLPGFPANSGSHFKYPEVGLFWAIDPAHQGKGYATEAGRALIDFAFSAMNLGRIVATTEYTNGASMAVMRKLGLTLLRNPLPDPVWFQVVGLLQR